MGFARHQYVGHEGGLGSEVWRWVRRAASLEATPERENARHHAELGRHLGKDGPLVIDVPPGQQGILDDFWQRPISSPTIDGHEFAGDVGFAGPDQGKGGKYL